MEIYSYEQFYDLMLDILLEERITREEYDAITDYVSGLLDEIDSYE